MKKCPVCAEEINDEARQCRFCGAKFNISKKGYCTTCHQITDANENNACTRCGSTLVDLQIESEYIPQQTIPAKPASSTATPSSFVQPSIQSPKKKSPWKWILGSLVVFISLCMVVTIIMRYLPELASSYQGATNTSVPTLKLIPTRTSTPLPVGAAFYNPSREKGAACFDTQGYGLTCLDDSGWHTFTDDNSELESNSYGDITSCPNGNLVIGYSNGTILWDGNKWQSLYTDKPTHSVACGSQGEIWAAHGDGISYFDGVQWTHFESEKVIANFDPQIVSDCGYGCFGEIAITPNGDIWTLVKGNLAYYNGNAWIAIKAPTYLSKIGSDQNGHVWTIADDVLYHYVDDAWDKYRNPREGQFTDLLIDKDNRVWLSTTSGEVLVFKDASWLAYDATGGGQISNNITHISMDGRGRLWVGSQWGLGVFDGQNWIFYHMHTADLGNYDIGMITVMAGGPDLPSPIEKERGTITGKIIIAGQPVNQKKVEVCQFHMGYLIFYSTSPCGSKHLVFETTTDENGVYRFENLPPGYYSLFYLQQVDDWNYGRKFLMTPGEEIMLPDIITEE